MLIMPGQYFDDCAGTSKRIHFDTWEGRFHLSFTIQRHKIYYNTYFLIN